jgi:hypothetical protein
MVPCDWAGNISRMAGKTSTKPTTLHIEINHFVRIIGEPPLG